MSKGRIFSGMQPSGKFHLENYLVAPDNGVRLRQQMEKSLAYGAERAYKVANEMVEEVRRAMNLS